MCCDIGFIDRLIDESIRDVRVRFCLDAWYAAICVCGVCYGSLSYASSRVCVCVCAPARSLALDSTDEKFLPSMIQSLAIASLAYLWCLHERDSARE